MKTKIPARFIMTYPPLRLNSTDSIEKAIGIFEKFKIRHLPVSDELNNIGILSTTDLYSFNGATSDTIEGLFTRYSVNIHEDETLDEFAFYFIEKGFHALPVVNDDNELTGIISYVDVIKYLLDYIQRDALVQVGHQKPSNL